MKNCKDCQTTADCTCKGKDFKACSFYVNNTHSTILNDALCQQILEKVEENAGFSHNVWDMFDPLELIADIVHTADKLRGLHNDNS